MSKRTISGGAPQVSMAVQQSDEPLAVAFSFSSDTVAIALDLYSRLQDRVPRETMFFYTARSKPSKTRTDLWASLKEKYDRSYVIVAVIGKHYGSSGFCNWEWGFVQNRLQSEQQNRIEILRTKSAAPRFQKLGPHVFPEFDPKSPEIAVDSVVDKLKTLRFPHMLPGRYSDTSNSGNERPYTIRRHIPAAEPLLARRDTQNDASVASNAIISIATRIGVADQWRKKRSVLDILAKLIALSWPETLPAIQPHHVALERGRELLIKTYELLRHQFNLLLSLFHSPTRPGEDVPNSLKMERARAYFRSHLGVDCEAIDRFQDRLRQLMEIDVVLLPPEAVSRTFDHMRALCVTAQILAAELGKSLMSSKDLTLLSSQIGSSLPLEKALEDHWRQLQNDFHLDRRRRE